MYGFALQKGRRGGLKSWKLRYVLYGRPISNEELKLLLFVPAQAKILLCLDSNYISKIWNEKTDESNLKLETPKPLCNIQLRRGWVF